VALVTNAPARSTTRPADPPSRGSERLSYVDGLRGFACLYVLLYHLFLLWPVSARANPTSDLIGLDLLTRFAAFGHIGVDIFLALSGFCLFYPLCVRASAGQPLALSSIRSYALRRARRIVPPYLAALVAFSVLPLWIDWARYVHPLPRLSDVVAHLLFVHNLFPATVLTIDGPLWSLALEAQLYVIFPLLILAFGRLGPWRFACLLFLACAAFRFAAWRLVGGAALSLESQFVVMGSLPGRVFEFAAGMLAAYLVTHVDTPSDQRRARIIALASIVGGAATAYAAEKLFGEHSPMPALLWGVFAFGLLVGARERALWPLRVFAAPPLVRIGMISYSIYLIHEPLLRLTGGYVRDLNLPPGLALAGFVVLVGPAVLAVSGGFFALFERPALRPRPTTRADERAAAPPRTILSAPTTELVDAGSVTP
jgi:peptidoglycan/LPS O-acetylase OafA/YrhL